MHRVSLVRSIGWSTSLLRVLLASLLWIATQASAATPAEFRASGLEIPSSLLAQGFRRVGELDLVEFIRLSRSVEVRTATEVITLSDPEMTRRLGRWSRGEGPPAISFDPKMWRAAFAEARPLVSLHEFLGALGFDDANYQATMVLWLLTRTDVRAALGDARIAGLEDVVRRLPTPAFLIAGPGGGIVGVGGGGDFMGVFYKREFIRDRVARLLAVTNEAERDAQFAVLMMLVRDTRVEIGWRPIVR